MVITNNCDRYWAGVVKGLLDLRKEDEKDIVVRDLSSLIEKCVECEQWRRADNEYFDPTVRVLRVRTNMSRKVIEKVFEVVTIPVKNVGLFIPIEGLISSYKFRIESGYDDSFKRRGNYNLDLVPDDLRRDYAFRLSIPAMDGLFIPKNTKLVDTISSVKQIQFLDVTS